MLGCVLCRKNLKKLAYRLVIFHSIFYLVLLVILAYASTLLTEASDNLSVGDLFLNKFERIVLISEAVFLFLPFVLSVILSYGLIKKKTVFLTVWTRTSTVANIILAGCMLGSGIYVGIKNQTLVFVYGQSILAMFLVLLMMYSVTLITKLKAELKKLDDIVSSKEEA